MQYVSERQDGWGDFKGLLFFSCFYLQSEELCKSCRKHSSWTSALLPTAGQKQQVFKSGALFLPGLEPALAQGLLDLLLWDLFLLKIQAHAKNRSLFILCGAMHLLCGTCPHVHPVAIQTCKVLFIVFIREATRACPWILPALLAALPKSSLGSGIVHRTWAKAQWSQWFSIDPSPWTEAARAKQIGQICFQPIRTIFEFPYVASFIFFGLFFWNLNYLFRQISPLYISLYF